MIAFSKVELIRAVVSAFIWREIDVPSWFPLSFTAYFVSLFLLSLVLRKQGETQRIPKVVVVAGGVFGSYVVATASVFLATKPA